MATPMVRPVQGMLNASYPLQQRLCGLSSMMTKRVRRCGAERRTIEEWMARSNTSPMTGAAGLHRCAVARVLARCNPA